MVFNRTADFKIENDIRVCRLIESRIGPLVHGVYALRTPANDDAGLPHTLERSPILKRRFVLNKLTGGGLDLVFLGSKKYPYKGYLDTIANKALAAGTNAWTDTDHTAYTISTAGHDGFLNVLPIYIDHILNPTITDAAFVTEVHHINGKAENAGVVYCEMQARENTEEDRTRLAMNRQLWAETPYQYETGGLMADLRALDVQTIRDYHLAHYRPENLVLTIMGQVPEADLLQTLERVDTDVILHEKYTTKVDGEALKKVVPRPLTKSVEEVVSFPDEDEEVGSVLLGYRGPLHEDQLATYALLVLGTYLTDSPISPFQKQFVEREDALAGDVSFSMQHFKAKGLLFSVDSVEASQLDTIVGAFDEAMQNVLTSPLDMDRLKTLVRKQYIEQIESLETAPEEVLAGLVIVDFLYGTDKQSLQRSLQDTSSIVDTLLTWSAKEWLALIARYFDQDQPRVVINGRPSSATAQSVAEEETTRLADQRTALGESKLAELQATVDRSLAEHQQKIPAEVLAAFPEPGMAFNYCKMTSTHLPTSLPS